MSTLTSLPQDLPRPLDDGAADHLLGEPLPDLIMPSTAGHDVHLDGLEGWGVLYLYPMTGVPNVPLPEGWDDIPGARGCTPQACAYRDHFADLKALGVHWVYGLSTQSTAYQQEMAERLHLPFAILSDERGALIEALSLPTFWVNERRLLKRLTLIVIDGIVRAVHYPVFPSDQDPEWVMASLKTLSRTE
jgi:peroxiredoxin